jgi:TonB family protein
MLENEGEFLTPRRKDARTQRIFARPLIRLKSVRFLFASLRLCVFALILCLPVCGQRLAIITPGHSAQGERFSADLAEKLGPQFRVLDADLSSVAFGSLKFATPFNLTATESKQAASVIGCDFFLLIRTGSLRRSSFERPEYYEAFAAIYLVSGRSGSLIFWKMNSFAEDSAANAETQLLDSSKGVAEELAQKIALFKNSELGSVVPQMEEVPATDLPRSKNFRAPIPYKRIKPEYTQAAFLYDTRATVDIEADIDAAGNVTRTAIVRWAGFGLDESVIDVVRKMNWRPAERNGKTLPMRVLLRYNFIKHEKE